MRASIALFPVLFLAGCDRQATPAPQPRASESAGTEAVKRDMTRRGQTMPATIFTAPDGKPTTLASFKGRPVLVNLWATWCAPCVREMPSLDRLARRGAGKLVVLAVNQTDGAEAVARWWGPRGFTTLKPYRDEEGKLGFDFASGVLPTTILYDAQGKELWRIVGGMDWDGRGAGGLLADVLGRTEANPAAAR